MGSAGRWGARGAARLAWVATATLLLATVTAVGGSTIEAEPAAAAPVGCGYANSSANNGAHASTICWFDFTAFNMTQARSTTGQPMQITLDGGYVASFTVRFADLPGRVSMSVERRSTPLETRFAFGSDAYRGVPGLHSLYSLGSPAGVKGGNLSFEDIQIVDALGAPVSGFSFVAADTEDNVAGESFAWSSDKPLTEIERLAPAGNWGCKTPIGLGTTDVSCAGTGAGGTTTAGGKSTALLVAADSPTRFSTQWVTGARSGIAVGIQTAKITMVKQVEGRIDPADSFDISVVGSTGSVMGSGTTGVAGSATTGALNVLAGGTFTLTEAATSGSPTDLSNYVNSWSCTNANAASATPLPSGTGVSKTVSPVAGDDITCTVTNTAKAVSIALLKSAGTATDVNGNGIVDVGDTIPYTFTVTNSGSATVENVGVSDPKLGPVTCAAGSLASGADLVCTSADPYTVTAADEAAGAVLNSATASASPLGSTVTVTSAPSTTSTPVDTPAPGLTMTKSATPSSAAAYTAGQPITYSFVVTNSGNVTVSNVQVVDTAFSGSGTLGAITCPAGSETLLAGEQATCTASYTLTLDDVNSGSLGNTAIASGDPVGGPGPVTSEPSSFALPVDPAPAVSLAKSATPATASMPGDVIDYAFAVTNTGNVSLSAASITETAFTGTGAAPSPSCPTGTFLPGVTVTCTATYELTQADVDTGTVTNTAIAAATAPNGPDPQSAASSATVTIPAAPALTLTKSADTSGAGMAGDIVTYSYLIVNTGNVTVDDLGIDETTFSGSGTLDPITCPVTSLPAGDDTTCTVGYTLTQADVDAGRVDNTAVAVGDPVGPTTTVSSPPSSATVNLTRVAAITLTKSVSSVEVRAGDAVVYSFRVTNTGTVTLTSPVITETAFSGTGPVPVATCPAGALAPGASITCTAPYTVTPADALAGSVTNTATVSAIAPTGVLAPVSAASTAPLTVTGAAALALTGATIAWVGSAAASLLLAAGVLVLAIRRRARA